MNEALRQIEVKIGKRTWRLLVGDTADPVDEIAQQVGGTHEHAVDLLVISSAEDQLLQRWDEWTQQSVEQWETRLLTACRNEEMRSLIQAGALIIGPRRLVDRFCRAVAPDETPDSKVSSSRLKAKLGLEPSALPDPADVPPFREEGKCDPFGLNAALQNAAWLEVAAFAAQIAAYAHQRRLAVSLPPPPPGEADADLKPWRTVVSLEDELMDWTTLETFAVEDASNKARADLSRELDLVQRCLLSSASIEDETRREKIWDKVSVMLEHFGYLLLSKQVDIESLPHLVGFFEIGAWAGRAHSNSILHGDMHPGNFGGRRKDSPLGERVLTFDAGDSDVLDRPLTPKERAQDLTILKTQCTFLQWEAAKLGYRFKAPDVADQVFEFFEVTR